jgi:hypothetical protein
MSCRAVAGGCRPWRPLRARRGLPPADLTRTPAARLGGAGGVPILTARRTSRLASANCTRHLELRTDNFGRGPTADRPASEEILGSRVAPDALAFYGRWWQLETWLWELVYVELRAKPLRRPIRGAGCLFSRAGVASRNRWSRDIRSG